ncbi:hypothetical protein GCM10023310_39030 [Paenibacillus vulneris]|uniref:Sigma-70 family RNA polymerase sigma factor n=1 Tax=Paenibacillus vulneris TaxID=1133364 RepID=A0ABW3UNV0_9BACL
MNEQNLEHWLDRLMTGDEEALEVIYGMTRKKVYGTVGMLVRNKQDVNDIVNEIYYQLWRALPSYDRRRPFLFWLNGIVIRQVNHWRRQSWRRFRLIEKHSRLGEEPQVELPGEALIESEFQRELQETINQLPYKLRIVVIYRFYYDYTYEQIAELLQIPTGTAKSRVHLALKQLRKRFDTELDGEEYQHVFFKKILVHYSITKADGSLVPYEFDTKGRNVLNDGKKNGIQVENPTYQEPGVEGFSVLSFIGTSKPDRLPFYLTDTQGKELDVGIAEKDRPEGVLAFVTSGSKLPPFMYLNVSIDRIGTTKGSWKGQFPIDQSNMTQAK